MRVVHAEDASYAYEQEVLWQVHRPPNELRWRSRQIKVGQRSLQTTEVFDTYWRFAARRQALYEARTRGAVGPWSTDPILARHRFTNCYRASDRVSQFVIKNVAYEGSQKPEEVIFRTLLFKFFNKIETWLALSKEFGPLQISRFDVDEMSDFLLALSRSGPIYSAAYVIPQPGMGAPRKATNHLLLLRKMLEEGLPERIHSSGSMEEAFLAIRAYPGIGDFLAYQFVIDINYSNALNFDEMEFVVPGPGARDGIRKCFGAASAGREASIIRYMADSQDEHFERLGLQFGGLMGKRKLTLIDCQNLFCETDKYARVAHPEILGLTRRKRIKQVFRPKGALETPWFPPKWGINPR
ncbi:nucleotide kinase domain-containing protein [Terracoccus sp. 273MFTsu3.1]|uniref:nucleotide kinase domain-containing protein n=1 Tax=Terracoccus sp. 273MFTsu3.1 TaxID=1172188 RepID=UPI0018CB80E8|nr:nucleotide kinase domain-containing protein [Terracoccus sp. 273MFTsu3.1]